MFCLNSPQKLTKRIIWISQPCLTYKLLSNDNDHVVQQLEKRLLLPHRRPKTHPEPAEVSHPLLCEGGGNSPSLPRLCERGCSQNLKFYLVHWFSHRSVASPCPSWSEEILIRRFAREKRFKLVPGIVII